MEYLVVAFRSRSSVVAFYEILKNRRINCEIINTPKEAMVGCGLSIKTSLNLLPIVKGLVISSRLKNFAGFFHVKVIGGKRFVKSM